MRDLNRRALTYKLFSQALDMSAELRARWLDTETAEDASLRADVEALLAMAASDNVHTHALLSGTLAVEQSLAGRLIGRFRLEELIGEGGMGVVYRAERADGVHQSVAIKLVSTSLAPSVQARFEREAQILARLEHPSVARLIDAGIEEGRAWIAMEFIRGERIDAFCANHRLATRDIVRLLVQLAGAVAAAHALLVVHSDIKPANVLVTADGQPKLIDFGIATALRDAGAEGAPTVNIARLFSPNYAAPEQITGGPVTVASDVFGLGALAYRLLAGTPIHRDATSAVSYLLAATQRDVELASQAARAAGGTEPDARLLRGDLDAILAKALERNPSRRFASAADFKADLQRYLDGRPVRARVPSAGYRLGKFLARNALAVGLSSVLAVSSIAGAVVAWIQARENAVARNIASQRGEFLESVLKSANPRDGRRDITVAELLDASQRKLDDTLHAEPLVEASMLDLIADTNTELGRYPEALAARDRQLAILRAQGAPVTQVARALSRRGDVLSRAGKYAEAEAPLAEAVAMLRGRPGANETLVDALGTLGAVYANTNREAKAEATLHEAIALDNKRTGVPQHQLAVLLGNQGLYAQSAALAGEALALQRKNSAPGDPTLLITEATYAMTLSNLRRPLEADPLFRDLVASSVRIRGPEHPDTLVAQDQLAANLMDLHRYAEAAPLLRQTAEALDRVVGPTHRYSLGTWSDYAVAACNNHDEQAGMDASQRVLDIRRRILPPTDWHIAANHAITGMCLAHLKRFAEAEPLLLQAVADLEAARGPQFYQTQRAYVALNEMYGAMGRTADAQRFAVKISH